MTLLDRLPERVQPTPPRSVTAVAGRWYTAITPNDGTLLSHLLVRFRNLMAVVALGTVCAVAGAQLADRTHPGICLAEQGGHCAVELTPHRDGEVTIRRGFAGEPVLEARVPAKCLHPGPPVEQCPGWLLDWQPPAGVG